MYRISYAVDLEKILRKIPKKDVLAIRDALNDLSNDPRGSGTQKLSGREGYRIRAGNYRVI